MTCQRRHPGHCSGCCCWLLDGDGDGVDGEIDANVDSWADVTRPARRQNCSDYIVFFRINSSSSSQSLRLLFSAPAAGHSFRLTVTCHLSARQSYAVNYLNFTLRCFIGRFLSNYNYLLEQKTVFTYVVKKCTNCLALLRRCFFSIYSSFYLEFYFIRMKSILIVKCKVTFWQKCVWHKLLISVFV